MNYLEKLLKRKGWFSILESVIFAILGAILIMKPEGTVTFISYVLGIVFILFGIFKILAYLFSKEKNNFYNYDMVYGLMAIVIGIITIVYSNTLGSIFRIIIGIWITYTSFVRMNLSIELWRIHSKIWIYSLLLAIVMLICGLYVIMNSGAIVVTIGVIMVISSIIDIIEEIVFMKNIKEFF